MLTPRKVMDGDAVLQVEALERARAEGAQTDYFVLGQLMLRIAV